MPCVLQKVLSEPRRYFTFKLPIVNYGIRERQLQLKIGGNADCLFVAVAVW